MGKLITPKLAAEMFGVTTNCLIQWEQLGKLRSTKTLGGHRRYLLDEINKLLLTKNTSNDNVNRE